jgi:hypothetical protein
MKNHDMVIKIYAKIQIKIKISHYFELKSNLSRNKFAETKSF